MNTNFHIANNNLTIDQLNSIFKDYQEKNKMKIYQNVSFNKGENILKQGSFLSHQTILLKGVVKLVLESDHKKNYIFKLALPGDFIGLSASFHDEISPFSAICMCDSDVLLIKPESFKKLFTENTILNDYIVKLRSNYFRLIYEKLTLQATKNSFGKLAHVILYIKQLQCIVPNIYQYITRKDLADMAGLSYESVMKILNEYKEDKLISIKNSEIKINSQELLERLVNIG